MTVFRVRHLTTYQYECPVQLGEHRLFFRPRDSYDQRLIEATINVHPAPAAIRWAHDVFGNCLATVTFDSPARELHFETTICVDHRPHSPHVPASEGACQPYPFAYLAEEAQDLQVLSRVHLPSRSLEAWSRGFLQSASPKQHFDIHALMATLCTDIHNSFTYQRRSAHGTQPPETTLRLRRGTCRDFALLMMEAARMLGLAARFVTGYIYVPSRDGSKTLGGGSTHAWCEVYIPGSGWAEFDPTNGIVGNRDLIRVAVAREPRQVVPLSGSYVGKSSDLKDFAVQVNVTTESEALAA